MIGMESSILIDILSFYKLITILVLKFEKKSILLPVDMSKLVLDEWQIV